MKPEGKGSYRTIIPRLPWFNYFIPRFLPTITQFCLQLFQPSIIIVISIFCLLPLMTSEFYCDKIMEFLNGSGPNSSSATQTNVATPPLDSTGATTPSTSISLPSIDKPKEPTLVAGERFSFVSKEELSVLSKGVKIVNTTKATSWAVKNFNDWKRATNARAKGVLVPDDFFSAATRK